jgi:hypothetical protein
MYNFRIEVGINSLSLFIYINSFSRCKTRWFLIFIYIQMFNFTWFRWNIYHFNNVLTVLYILYCILVLGSKMNLLVLLLNGLAKSRKSLHRKATNSLLLFNCNRNHYNIKSTNFCYPSSIIEIKVHYSEICLN